MEPKYYTVNEDGTFTCRLCPHKCVIENNKNGFCGVRGVRNGSFRSLAYGRIAAGAVDPIEKKPFYHYMPGATTLSVGFYGCNMNCPFCQNCSISRTYVEGPRTKPAEIVRRARNYEQRIIAYTYNEPTTNFEFVLEAAQLAKEEGLTNILVTNGFINQEPLRELLPYFSAINIDIKSSRPDIYRNPLCGDLLPVLAAVKTAASACHVEVCALMAPDICTVDDVRNIARFLAAINDRIPLHVNRYYPARYYIAEMTPLAQLEDAQREAQNYLKHVYIGNVG